MKATWYENGKLKRGENLPSGLFHQYPGQKRPSLIDKNYEGFKIIYLRDDIKKTKSHQIIIDSIEVKSLADGKYYSSKSKYYQSIRDSGGHIVESGESNRKREIVGDFNVRKELTQATQQVLSQHGRRK